MTGGPSAQQRAATGRLRAELRRWIDENQHDPGITMAELLAYLADVLSTYQDRAADESGLGHERYIRLRLQEGRVQVDIDWDQGTDEPRRFGLYRGVVVDAADPLGTSRLQVEIPGVLGPGQHAWALPSLPAGGSTPTVPAAGAAVWIAFEEGDVDRPVWLGGIP